MNLSRIFIERPVATSLLAIGLATTGILCYTLMPVSALPRLDFPVVSVSANDPGADPQTMASSVAMPLERKFGQIAGLNSMTSASYLGYTNVVLQFDLDRDINGAVRDVESAINAASGQLPSDLPSKPTYRKVNPADTPILALALTSDKLSSGELYDIATTVLQQKLSQLPGVGQVICAGASLPAVRAELNPLALSHYNLSFEQVRSAIANANADRPKGHLSDGRTTWQIATNDRIGKAADYAPIVVGYSHGAAVQLSDLGHVDESVENILATGISNGKPAVLVVILRQPGANVISTVDGIRAALPSIKAEISPDIDIHVGLDPTRTIRASVDDVQKTLVISVILVTLVVFLFLRRGGPTLIAGIAVPISILITFVAMKLLDFSLDNLSLMALTISTGFVIDDAIVVIEDVMRHIEEGLSPLQAALAGAKEVGFTVFSITISLVAVFIPLLFMGGLIGRLFREFSMTLSVAILASMVVSLTLTPMLCSRVLRAQPPNEPRWSQWLERCFGSLTNLYERTLSIALRHKAITLSAAILTLLLNIGLIIRVPKGFFPEEDTGRITVGIQSSGDTSFQQMQNYLGQMVKIIDADPAVVDVIGYTGSGSQSSSTANTAQLFISLKPLKERKSGVDAVTDRLRKKLASVVGATAFLQPVQDIRVGGRGANAQYQYTLQSLDPDQVERWVPIMEDGIRKLPGLSDVSDDTQRGGLRSRITYDRQTAARLGVNIALIDSTLYDAFGQRQVSTINTDSNQYHVVMEAAPEFWTDPRALDNIYITSQTGSSVPLSAIAHWSTEGAPLAQNHQLQVPAGTISFNTLPGTSLGDATNRINALAKQVHLPANINGSFQGTAQVFQESLREEPILIAMALLAVYIVLGILYESLVHPITILSTLPSAGVGALIAIQVTGTDLNVIAMIGIILLIGIVKKNAIMMIDFTLQLQRTQGLAPLDAVYQACVLRFRPILMTTMAALLGAVPLAIGTGEGAELRHPLGITIIGGLLVSQLLTLYTTPVIYLYLEEVGNFVQRLFRRGTQLVPQPASPSFSEGA